MSTTPNNQFLRASLEKICQIHDISLTSLSSNWLFELRKGRQVGRMLGFKFGLNESVPSYISEDKVATYELLRKNDIPAVPHLLTRNLESLGKNWQRLQFDQVVTKPLTGKSGRDVLLLPNIGAATRWLRTRPNSDWVASPFLDIKHETRLILLDQEILLAYQKEAITINGLKMFNLSLGAKAHVVEPSAEMANMAKASCAALGLRLAAIDIVELMTGELLVLEVNDGITLEHFSARSEQERELAFSVYEKIVVTMMKMGGENTS